jgi:outer membrane receptor protein involved in Fe transport
LKDYWKKVNDWIDGTGSPTVTAVGKAADSAAVSGNPVLTAGLYSVTPATRHDGDVTTLQTTATGALLTSTSIIGSLANDDEQLTIDNTVGGISLSPAKYGTSTKAFIQVETAPIRFRINGSAPTSTLGTLLEIGDSLELDSIDDIANFKVIRTTAVNATINCIYSS